MTSRQHRQTLSWQSIAVMSGSRDAASASLALAPSARVGAGLSRDLLVRKRAIARESKPLQRVTAAPAAATDNFAPAIAAVRPVPVTLAP